jgi:hypothetical protein
MMQRILAPEGTLIIKVNRRDTVPARELSFWEMLYYGFPRPGLSREVAIWRFRNIPNLFRGMRRVLLARAFNLPHFYGQLSLVVTRGNGEVVNLGLASLRVVTDTGVQYLVDSLQGTTEPENMKFHGYGTGTNAEAAGNTALQTELTTQYVGDVRPTGTQGEGASANIYRTTGTLSPDTGGTIAVTEHGVFSANSGGTLLDRSQFSAVNIVAGSDSLQSQYDLTLASGG